MWYGQNWYVAANWNNQTWYTGGTGSSVTNIASVIPITSLVIGQAGVSGGANPYWFVGDWFVAEDWFDNAYFGGGPGNSVSIAATIVTSATVAALAFYSGGGTALVQFESIRLRADVKILRERGKGTSSAGSATTVNFTKDWADIRYLDAFPVQNTGAKIYRVIDFVDAPDPSSFTVRFYNDSGTQLAIDFMWIAEGVLKT